MSTLDPLDPGAEIANRLRFVCEAHDDDIGEHIDRVSHYACELARLVGYSDAKITMMRIAAPLHDIGKIGVPLELLNKPGRLTPAQMETIKSHTVIGHRILKDSSWPVMESAAAIAWAHHECWDGTGYPRRQRGAEIAFDARLVAIADVYDALRSQRAYKPAWEEDRVLTEMRSLRGTKFDPELLDVFIDKISCMSALPPDIAYPRLSEGETTKAVVFED